MDRYPPPHAPALDDEELAYIHAERHGMRLDSELCPECPDPALCQAERYCQRGEA